jgi:hypothetical protein
LRAAAARVAGIDNGDLVRVGLLQIALGQRVGGSEDREDEGSEFGVHLEGWLLEFRNGNRGIVVWS